MSSSATNGRSGGISKRVGLTLALTLLGAAAFASSAQAGSVTKAAGTITFLGETTTNTLTVTESGGNFVFQDTTINPTNGGGCNAAVGNTVTCSDSGVTSIVLDLGTGNTADTGNGAGVTLVPITFPGRDGVDTLTGGTQADIIAGERKDDILSCGPGADTITGGTENDTINGGDGNDDLSGDDGTDTINGGNDNDSLIGDDGADDLNGDDGNDRLDGGDNANFDDDIDGGLGLDRLVNGTLAGHTYTCTQQALSITLDNVNNDSLCSDGGSDNNNIRDSVESVTGSTLGDSITGSCVANTFAGSNGTANGATDGADTFNGDPNTCASGNGNDFLGGGEGNDVFNCDGTTGAAGFDTVTYGSPYTGGGAISVTLDNNANDNDGMGNTTENVQSDCNRIIGTANADVINATASASDNIGVQLFGRAGDDVLTDGPFDDLLNGEGNTTASPGNTANCINGGTDTALNIQTNNGCEL